MNGEEHSPFFSSTRKWTISIEIRVASKNLVFNVVRQAPFPKSISSHIRVDVFSLFLLLSLLLLFRNRKKASTHYSTLINSDAPSHVERNGMPKNANSTLSLIEVNESFGLNWNRNWDELTPPSVSTAEVRSRNKRTVERMNEENNRTTFHFRIYFIVRQHRTSSAFNHQHIQRSHIHFSWIGLLPWRSIWHGIV